MQITKIRNENGNITTNSREDIIRKYYEHMYTHKLDNIDGIDKFLEKQNLPRLNHEEIVNLNRCIFNRRLNQ